LSGIPFAMPFLTMSTSVCTHLASHPLRIFLSRGTPHMLPCATRIRAVST
jgi:hypothetical protein